VKGYICENCKKLTFGICPVCKGELICKMDGCTKKTWREWICEEHYKEMKG